MPLVLLRDLPPHSISVADLVFTFCCAWTNSHPLETGPSRSQSGKDGHDKREATPEPAANPHPNPSELHATCL